MDQAPFKTLLAAALFLFILSSCSKKEVIAPKHIPVKTTYAIAKSVPLYLETTGHISPYNTVNVMAQASGYLLETHFEDGAYVKKGELLYTIDPAPYLALLQLAEGELKEQIAQRDYAKRHLKRNTPLAADEYISKNTYDDLQTTVVIDDALIEQSLANVETAKINLGYTQIYAPMDARAGDSLVDNGNLILEDAETTLVTLNQITPIYMFFFMNGKHLQKIQRYQKSQGELTVIARVQDPEISPYEGKLDFIDNQVDLATGMVELRAVFPNEDKTLWPNQYVTVKLILTTLDNAILVPTSAIQTSAKGHFVFTIKGDDRAHMQPIELGQRQPGDCIVVTRGLKEGDRVVTDGHSDLSSDAKVRIISEKED